MNPEMQYTGQKLTKAFESCRLEAYPDSKGVPTIGWGHTRGVKLGDTCTQEQADDWLNGDLSEAVWGVNHYVAVQLNQEEFNAVVDLVFNIGVGNFSGSTLLRKLNCGDISGAANEFERWDMAGGVHVAGLLRRRIAEKQEFLS